jgi:hypothetical protein
MVLARYALFADALRSFRAFRSFRAGGITLGPVSVFRKKQSMRSQECATIF